MTFEEILDQAMAMLQRRGRLTYSTLKRQFQLDDAALDDVKNELLFAHPQVHDEAERGLVWTGEAATAPSTSLAPAATPDQGPLTYTPPYLAEKILTSRSALEGERKQVTVLFADLKGSTELIRGLDPEAAQQLLDPALHHMMDAVHRYEGTVNQVLGDGIMALFGAPIAHEDHALRACYAALAMQDALRRYADEVRRTHGLTVQMRVGLHSGDVVVRTIANDLRMDYSAVGLTTVLAARMEQLATPGSMLLTAATLRLVEGLVQVTPLGPVPVKGVDEPVEVFALVGVSAIRRRLQAAVARGLSPFIGRQPEVEALQQALALAGAGQGQVVALLGEPGVGKSRLVYEFVQSRQTQGWLRLESSAVSYGTATAYLPVCDLLKAYCQIADRDALRTVQAKITGQILTLDATLQETVPAVLALFEALPAESPFLQLDPVQRRRQTLEALKRILLRESQVQPLLLVFEDLHWIDSETQALLDSLVESLPTARLLVLVNYRPEYQHGWGSKTFYTQLRLDPLPPASAEALLQALLGADASLVPLTQLLIARTQGNPFFLEESVRTLVETAVLAGDRGAYHLAQPLETLQVPATVQALLAARIDRLPPEHKRLLQTAAVIGTEVPWALLQAIADTPDEALSRSLDHLQAAEFLYETSLFPEPAYTFKHALTHEVASGSLLHERRRALHARIVEALEALVGDRRDDQVERLAHHALRGDVWAKALTYARQAGEKALERSAYREAVEWFEQALSVLPHLPETRDTCERAIDLRAALGDALWPLGDHQRRFASLCQAETLATAMDDARRLSRISIQMVHHFRVMGDDEQAIAYGQQALTLATTLGELHRQCEAHLVLGRTYYAMSDYRQAIASFRQVVTSFAEERLPVQTHRWVTTAVLSRVWLGLCLAEHGEFAEALRHADAAIRLADMADHPYSRIHAYFGVGGVYLTQGDVAKAIDALERSLGLYQRWEFPLVFRWIAVQLGYAYTLAGRVTAALPLLEHAVQQGTALRSSSHPRWVAWLSEAYLVAGRWEDARRVAGQAFELARRYKERGHEAYAFWLLGEMAVQHTPSETEQAAAHYQQALALADALGMRPLQAHCHRGLGTLYGQTGRVEQARAELSAAIDLYRVLDMTFWLPQAGTALAQVEGR